MIRGQLNTLVFLAAVVVISSTYKFQNLEITSAERSINLSGSNAFEFLKIKFVANDDHVSIFSYLVPLEYDSKISKLIFSKSQKDRSSLSYHRSIYIHQGISCAHYQVKLSHNYNIGEEGQIVINIAFINRYVNLPASITLNEDQKLQYEDHKFLLSPYAVQEQQSIYKFARFIDFDADGEKKGLNQVNFKAFNSKPFSIKKHFVFGVNNSPQILFSQVQRVIQLSHWGNVGITQNYKIVNTGPSLKGQFSRVTFGSRSSADARNAFKGIEFDLPEEVWGLYYQDEVGNISTSKAWRDQGSRAVHVSLQPRFALLGGWKSNWQIGYNFKTDGHLYHTDDKFVLKNIKLQYALEKIISEEYTVKIILPFGAKNVRIRIGDADYDMSLVEVTTSEGYLDFEGKPTYIIGNYKGILRDKNIEVHYDFAQINVYLKPIILLIIVLSFLLFAIFASRFKLQAFSDNKRSD